MGLFDSLFQKKPTQLINEAGNYFRTLTAYQPAFTNWNGMLYESELVRSCIDARARHLSKLRMEIIGSAKPKLQTKLRLQPNDFQTWSQFLYRLSTILDMQNTAFIVPVIDKEGDVSGYFPVLTSRCEVKQTKIGKAVLVYTFVSNEKAAVYLDECGILTKFQYKDDLFGENNNALTDTMSLIDIQNQGIKEAVKSSATYRFYAQVNNFSKTEDLKKERMKFSKENLSKESESGGILLFPNTYSNITQFNSKPFTVDADQRKLIQENAYNYFGVNEDILQNKATGDAWNAFYEGAIEPISIQLSEVMTKITFSQLERAYGSQIVATANRMQYLSNKEKLEVSAQMADRGLMSINEIRDIWNLPHVEGGDSRTVRGEYYQIKEDGTTTKENESEK